MLTDAIGIYDIAWSILNLLTSRFRTLKLQMNCARSRFGTIITIVPLLRTIYFLMRLQYWHRHSLQKRDFFWKFMDDFFQTLFEILSSEASYLKSLNVVISHYMEAKMFNPKCQQCSLKRHEYHTLFSNILAVRKVSNRWVIIIHTHINYNVVLIETGNGLFCIQLLTCTSPLTFWN